MTALADRVILAFGWWRAAIAMAAGAVGALAMPPFGALPAMVVSLTVAVWLVDGSARQSRAASVRAAAAAGWLWGFGYFVAGLWWLGSAFLVEADLFAWALPFGVLGLPAVLAVFPAFGFAAARLLWSEGAGRVFALTLGLAVAEWLRGHVFTGFPWNTLGMALGQNPWLMQTAAVVGLYGLTVLAVLICAAPATIGTGRSLRARALPTGLGVLLLVALASFGGWRLSGALPGEVAGVRLRIMQPNLPQDVAFVPSERDAVMRRYLDLSDRATSPETSGLSDITHLVWPESAFPFLLHQDAAALAEIGRRLRRGAVLITGAARRSDPAQGEEAGAFFNSIQVVGDDGSILGRYDKVHLVPFGEYLPAPFEWLLRRSGLRPFVQVPGGFAAGRPRALPAIPGLPVVAATICYEAIFPEEVVPPGPRPGLILNVTNDAWFGTTPGPYQHLAQARLRSVEQGLPMVRAANSGISAVVDPYGRMVASLPLGIEGVLDARLPAAATATPFSRYGPLALCLMLLGCGAAALLSRRQSRHF